MTRKSDVKLRSDCAQTPLIQWESDIHWNSIKVEFDDGHWQPELATSFTHVMTDLSRVLKSAKGLSVKLNVGTSFSPDSRSKRTRCTGSPASQFLLLSVPEDHFGVPVEGRNEVNQTHTA